MIYGTCYDYYVAIPAKEKHEIFMRQQSYLSQGTTYLKVQFPFEPETPFIGSGTQQKQSTALNFSQKLKLKLL